MLSSPERAVPSAISKDRGVRHNFFTALNTAFIRDGAFIESQADTVVEQPIHLVFVPRGTANPCLTPKSIVAARIPAPR